jgi:hypothetical protein
MLDVLLSWAVIGTVVTALLGVGVGVMSTTSPEFTIAKWCFSAAYLVLVCRLGWWGVVEQAEGGPHISVISTLLLCVFFGALWIGAMHWVDTRHAEDIRAVRREQQETLTGFVEEGLRVRETYRSLEHVPRTAAREWDMKVYEYLEKNLGHAYAVQFRGPNTTQPIPNLCPPEMSQENYKFHLYFNMRLAQLDGIIRGLLG